MPGKQDFRPVDLVRESAGRFEIHSRVYTDPDVFRQEMESIFTKTWVYVGHESEVATSGEFKSAYIGLQPVILCRDDTARINVFFNRCRHRGAVVCREQRGRTRQFRCFYHGWTYNTRGDLIGLAQRSGYPADFPQKEMGLVRVARVETYRGLIFASLNPEVCSLEDHLGQARDAIDVVIDSAPGAAIAIKSGSLKFKYSGNWKLVLENTVDGYHGNYVHSSFQEVTSRSADKTGFRQVRTNAVASVDEQVAFRELGGTRGYPRGHATLDRPYTSERLDDLRDQEDAAEYIALLEKAMDKERILDVLGQHNVFIFPNFYFGSNGMLWVIHPLEVDRTEVYQFPFSLIGAPDQWEERRLRIREQFYGPSGFGTPDDSEVLDACQAGMQALEPQWNDLSRGIARETIEPPGVRRGHSTDETPQRSMYRAWREQMAEVQ
jgi:phenylpropionate dioxygenase-like ring-hydroxylating dioxygenase large terminal subunit